ncbi:MAG TPA: N-acetyl-gamma-glutamyl-phosphate reductase [Salinivirga sp.]|uniref:N-acetyl-gamma-glutamyl-phosphate reductase n=1 Tax=Salinivirga sp. TaxID=1970192 RepID=UPI002B48F04D|nr:N-acetyl-gamma-glutamyl-phosphate reductase [Salinivirga sp.]HKK59283.1 N-acetyl-gamma-glutamyl-phosphate reductase [Salinivirga sp.]
MTKKRVAIIGATGYTGSELVRILVNHPEVEITMITSETYAGKNITDVHPFLQGIADYKLHSVEDIDAANADLVFLALPHGVSMDFVKRFQNKPFKIVDLSGDFRLQTPEVYEEWYQKAHSFSQGFSLAKFGLPELFSDEIKQSNLVANPGCFPTGAILGAAPLLADDYIEASPLIVDSKTGVTGAGIKSKPVNLYSNVNDNFKAYGLKKHRHTIEIQEVLGAVAGNDIAVQFTPHLLPIDRGILSTIYAKPKKSITDNDLQEIYSKFYAGKPFVRLRNQVPATKDVRGSNYCDIYTTYDDRTGMILVISAIDNLVKGAAGQAVHNMNLMLGLEERAGLNLVPVQP